MSTTNPATSITAPVVNRTPWQRWRDFWFHPSDPTTLGFIRITTGLLVLYIHLTYSLDLQGFFGPHGWYAGRFIERERLESPSFVQPLNDRWEDPPPVYAQLSEYPHRRSALMQYLRSLPADPAARSRDLAFLNRVSGFQEPLQTHAALEYILRIGVRESDLDRYITALSGGTVLVDREPEPLVFGLVVPREPLDLTKTYRDTTPEFFLALPNDQKAEIANEVRALWHSLSYERVKWLNPDRDRSYVISHFQEVGPALRRALLDFIANLPADDAERKARLDYIEYWNSDSTKTYRMGGSIFSIWFHVKNPTEMALVHSGVLILILLFTLGLFTRVTSVLVWLATVSYIHRTQQVLFGMDTMMNILLFYLMIGNSGAALSLDRLIARYRAVRANLRRSATLDANTRAFLAYPPPSMRRSVAAAHSDPLLLHLRGRGVLELKGALVEWAGVLGRDGESRVHPDALSLLRKRCAGRCR